MTVQANDMSKVTRTLVCILLTPVFFLLACFALVHLKIILSGFTRDWYQFPLSFKKTTIHMNLLKFFLRSIFNNYYSMSAHWI